MDRILLILLADVVFGKRNTRKGGKDHWNEITQEQAVRTKNRPIDGSGAEIRLGSFAEMEKDSQKLWRDHLIASYTAGSGCKRPFMLRKRDGEWPVLTVLHKGSRKVVVEEGPRGKRKRGRPPKSKSKSYKPSRQDSETEALNLSDGSESSDEEGSRKVAAEKLFVGVKKTSPRKAKTEA